MMPDRDRRSSSESRPQMGPGPGPRGHMAMMSGEKAKNFKATLRELWNYLRPYRIQLIIVLIFAVASTVFLIMGPRLLGDATTELFNGIVAKMSGVPGGGINFGAIGHIVMLLIVLYVFSAACTYTQGFVMTGVAMKVTYVFRKNIAEKIDRLPLKYFDRVPYGEVLSRVTNDVDSVNNTLAQSLTQLVTAVTTLIGVLVMMFTISWIMTLAALVILPVSMILIRIIVKMSQKYFKQQQDYLGNTNGHVEEMYGGHTIMKAYNGEEKSIAQFNVHNDNLYGAAWKAQFLSGSMMPVMQFVGNLGYILVSILGGYLAVIGTITVGDILAFIQYIRMFTQPIMQTAQIASIMQLTAAAAERVFESLDEPEIPADVGTHRRIPVAGARRGAGQLRARPLRLQPGKDHHQGLLRRGAARPEGGHRRADGSRQDDARQAHHALLRA